MSELSRDGFSQRLVLGLFLLSGLMVPAGLWLRPIHLQWWDPSHFPPIAAAMDAWIWSFRILVFGLFLRVGALAAFGAMDWSPRVRPLLGAGVIICVLGCLVSALGNGYYMDTGVWGSWAVTQRPTPEAQAMLLDDLRPVNAFGECLVRMGSVFYSLGSIFVGAALLRARYLPRWVAMFAVAYGVIGICVGMFMANNLPANLSVAVVHAAWCLAMVGAVGRDLRRP